MNAIYNFQFVDTDTIQFDYQNRSFLYGDGVFETMVFKHGNIRFLKDHLKRLRKGMIALSIENGNLLNIDYFYKNIMILLKQNELQQEARI
jgi:branched-chain amino acid aminotransferase